MVVRAKLWTAEPLQDGRCDVKLYINYKGKRRHKSLEIRIFPKFWDDKQRLVKKSHPLARVYNAKIQQEVNQALEHFVGGGSLAGLEDQAEGSFYQFTLSYVQELEEGLHPMAPGTINKYRSFRTRLLQWMKETGRNDLSFSEINIQWYESFKAFCISKGNAITGGFNKHIQTVKALMNKSRDRELHQCTGHQHKDFKRHRNRAEKIYLTESEILRIQNLDLTDRPGLERERDRFLVSYYFILRYGDSIKLRPDFFFERDGRRYYRNIAGKTVEHSVIPVKPDAWDILQRRNFDLSGDTNQEANRKLKTIAALANINNVVFQDGKSGPKWNFVTTHTARRSAATNLSLSGLSHQMIADLGGWGSLKSFEGYLRNSRVESAEAVKDHPFFQ